MNDRNDIQAYQNWLAQNANVRTVGDALVPTSALEEWTGDAVADADKIAREGAISAATAAGTIGEPSAPAQEEKTMTTRWRIQLTFREGGDYKSKKSLGLGKETPTNFVVRAEASALVERFSSLEAMFLGRHRVRCAEGRAKIKGGPQVRVQMTEYADNSSAYVRQGTADSSAPKARACNFVLKGASLREGSAFIDAAIAAETGELKRKYSEIVQELRDATEDAPRKPEVGSAPAEAGWGSHSTPDFSPNTVKDPEVADAEAGHPSGDSLSVVLDKVLLDRQWDKPIHAGFWCVTEGDFHIVRSVHQDPQAALADALARKELCSLISPEGKLVAPKARKPKTRPAKSPSPADLDRMVPAKSDDQDLQNVVRYERQRSLRENIDPSECEEPPKRMIGVQWDEDLHKGLWCVVEGEDHIVLATCTSEGAAIKLAGTAGGAEVVSPGGVIRGAVASSRVIPGDDALRTYDAIADVAYKLSTPISREIVVLGSKIVEEGKGTQTDLARMGVLAEQGSEFCPTMADYAAAVFAGAVAAVEGFSFADAIEAAKAADNSTEARA